MDAINGKYNPETFIPEWISRERFNSDKDKDGYIKWIWSFGNNGNDYLYGKDLENKKRKIHEFIVYGIESDITNGIKLVGKTVNERRLEWMKKSKERMEQIERLQSLENLHRLSQLKINSLSTLEPLSNIDYREYKYQDGDVVYCDIPYEDSKNSTDYGGGFNHEAFYEWASSQPFNVYYSSYTKGEVVWQKQVRSVMNSAKGACNRNEVLFKI